MEWTAVGVLRRRLLVNALVDPAEAAARLPAGLRPHVTDGGTVVGCCLLEVDDLRPARLPAATGITLRAAAHRISAEWDEEHEGTMVGVFVPERRTNSRLGNALGGRWFPGVHRPAQLTIGASHLGLDWRVSEAGAFDIAVAVTIPPNDPAPQSDAVGGTCLGATVALSFDRHGALEGAAMEPEHRDAREVTITELHSRFVDSFLSAKPAPGYLMENVAVSWAPSAVPHTLAANA